jgi:hypothetical protein
MKIVLLLLVLLGAQVAFAADAALSWSNPTTNVDGSSIPATGPGSIASTRLEWGTCSGTSFGTLQGSQSVPAPATTATITGLASGVTYCFRAFSINTFAEISLASNVVSRSMPNPVPRPPTLSSTVSVVWSHKRMGWGETLEIVGTAPLGTPCGAVVDAEAGMYQIDPAAVKLDRPLRGGVPVTFCG